MDQFVDYTKLKGILKAGVDEGHSGPVVVDGGVAALIEKLTSEQQGRPQYEGELKWKNVSEQDVAAAQASAGSLEDRKNLAKAWLINKMNAVANAQGFPDKQTKETVKEAAREGLKKTEGLSGQEIDDLIRNVIDPIRVRG